MIPNQKEKGETNIASELRKDKTTHTTTTQAKITYSIGHQL
ncbi:hypothetical protein VCRA2119O48_110098 [Vibrio crassostreae]|nr:hypothetical protein VCRA2119O48_110098 [Vibrio crassostreae]CAK3907094.1 hypothetical protein VCRA212O16_330039 [Vibrio crassostreae]